jgi:hypothetical protein
MNAVSYEIPRWTEVLACSLNPITRTFLTAKDVVARTVSGSVSFSINALRYRIASCFIAIVN